MAKYSMAECPPEGRLLETPDETTGDLPDNFDIHLRDLFSC